MLVLQGRTGTPNGHLEVLISILLTFRDDLGTLLGSTLHIFVNFLWFGLAKWETALRPMFLMNLGWKYCLNALAVCARSNVKTVVFDWFLFFHLFRLIHEFNDLRDGFRGHFEWFWWPSADFFWFLKVLDTCLKVDDFPGIPWETPGWDDTPSWW